MSKPVKVPKFKKWECVVIEWVDSCHSGEGWHHPDRKSVKISRCSTVGSVFK